MVYRGSADRVCRRGRGQADVKIFRMAEEKWGMKPENTYMIGDSLENDITGARNAGWKTIWMNYHRYALPEGVEKPDYTAYTEEELKKIWNTMFIL